MILDADAVILDVLLQVTLMELVLEFQGYNECQLMRLILLLERKKLIQLSQGIFRVTSPDEESIM